MIDALTTHFEIPSRIEQRRSVHSYMQIERVRFVQQRIAVDYAKSNGVHKYTHS